MKEVFRWGIIGPGRIAKKFADTVAGMPDNVVEAVASRSQQDIRALKEVMHTDKVYSSYEEIADDENIDAVYIATPHRYHFDNGMICLKRGKPILVEKAFTVNAPQAEQLINLAGEKNLFVMEAMWTRFFPILKTVRGWIEAGKIGNVELVQSTLGFVAEWDPDDRLLNPELAGGTVLDLGVYNLAMSQFIFPDYPQAINAVGCIGETGVDTAISVQLDYGGGHLSHFFSTFMTKPLTQVEIYGSQGHIIIQPDFYQTESVTLESGDDVETVTEPHALGGFEYEIAEAQRCIRAGLKESPLMNHQNTLHVMRMADEIRSQIGMRYSWE